MKINSKEAIDRLKRTAELYELYFDLSRFKFINSSQKNAAETYFSETMKSAEELNKKGDHSD